MTFMSKFKFASAVAAAIAVSATGAMAQKTLRFVPHADLKILDPIWTTAYMSRNHGYMIYDTLFAMDADGNIKLQMLGKHDVSADQLTHTMTLRDGLEWHDGQPVTAEDCVASIKRWAAKDSMGQKMMTFVDSMTAKDAKTFEIKPEGTDRTRGLGARQAVVERAVHDAEAGRRNRSEQADRGFHRLGPLHLQEGRVEAR